MFNPIKYLKVVIDLVRNPMGEAVAALEITDANAQEIFGEVDSTITIRDPRIGDFAMLFERDDSWTICPRNEFFKHYEFAHEPSPDPMIMTPVRTIKPL